VTVEIPIFENMFPKVTMTRFQERVCGALMAYTSRLKIGALWKRSRMQRSRRVTMNQSR
jgi:hypothetical protein